MVFLTTISHNSTKKPTNQTKSYYLTKLLTRQNKGKRCYAPSATLGSSEELKGMEKQRKGSREC